MRLNSTTTKHEGKLPEFADYADYGVDVDPPTLPPDDNYAVSEGGCSPSILRATFYFVLAIIVVVVVFAAFRPTHERDPRMTDAPTRAFMLERVGAR